MRTTFHQRPPNTHDDGDDGYNDRYHCEYYMSAFRPAPLALRERSSDRSYKCSETEGGGGGRKKEKERKNKSS